MSISTLNEMWVLSALENRKMYGLEIIAYLKDEAGIDLLIGSLYNITSRLENNGYIKSAWGDTTEERRGSRRRYYEITALGNRILDEKRIEAMKVWNVKPLTA